MAASAATVLLCVAQHLQGDDRIEGPFSFAAFGDMMRVPGAHGSPLGPDEVRAAKQNLGWPLEPAFYIPEAALAHFRRAVERGKQLATVLCTGCHGDNLAGTAFFDDPALGIIHAKNLTRGKGGIGAAYADADFVRTLRHGVRPDGTSVFVMPAKDFYYLSDTDVGSIVAYIRTVPPVDQEWGPKQFLPMGGILLGLTPALGMGGDSNAVGKGGAGMDFTLTSTAFANGQAVPVKYTGDGANVSPPLAWRSTASNPAAGRCSSPAVRRFI